MLTISPQLPRALRAKIEEHIPAFEQLPGVVIIHDLADDSVVYLSSRGLQLLNTTVADTVAKPHTVYPRRHFNNEGPKDYAPKLFELMERNNDTEMVTFFQQVRFAGNDNCNWHLSSAKVFHRDAHNLPSHAITIALPINNVHLTAKTERMLHEDTFLRQNSAAFNRLTSREKEILRLTALGKSAAEIADGLFIAETTVETHRRNLKAKLQVSSHFEVSQYARAFDLI